MPKDSLSPEGAHQMSTSIQKFWRDRGIEIRVRAVRIRLNTDAVPANIWALRSNLCFDANGNAYVKEID
jgi:hypothetical protein